MFINLQKKRLLIVVLMLAVSVMIGVFESSVRTCAATYQNKFERKEALKTQLKDRIHQSSDGLWYYIYRNDAVFFLQARQSILDDTSAAGDDIIIPELPESRDIVIVGRNRTAIANLTEGDIYSTYIDEGISKTKFTIPDTIDGYGVTGVGNPLQDGYENPLDGPIDETWYAFNNLNDYDLVVVPEGVDIVYDTCFYASGFKSVSLPDTLTHIGENAFYIDEQLKVVDIPESVTYIGPRAFRETPWLENLRMTSDQHLVIVNGILIDGIMAEGDVVIPQNVKVIGPWAFYGNATGEDDTPSKITSVTIPSSVTVIGDYAFAECRSLTKVNFGNNVERIGYLAFGRSGLKEIIVPSTVKYIDDGLCYECPDLETAKFVCNAEHYGVSLFDTW